MKRLSRAAQSLGHAKFAGMSFTVAVCPDTMRLMHALLGALLEKRTAAAGSQMQQQGQGVLPVVGRLSKGKAGAGVKQKGGVRGAAAAGSVRRGAKREAPALTRGDAGGGEATGPSRGRGRPPGSRNKKSTNVIAVSSARGKGAVSARAKGAVAVSSARGQGVASARDKGAMALSCARGKGAIAAPGLEAAEHDGGARSKDTVQTGSPGHEGAATSSAPALTVQADGAGGVPRRRGRPPGSKNKVKNGA